MREIVMFHKETMPSDLAIQVSKWIKLRTIQKEIVKALIPQIISDGSVLKD